MRAPRRQVLAGAATAPDVQRALREIGQQAALAAFTPHPAVADTAGATLLELEAEVNKLKAAARNASIIRKT